MRAAGASGALYLPPSPSTLSPRYVNVTLRDCLSYTGVRKKSKKKYNFKQQINLFNNPKISLIFDIIKKLGVSKANKDFLENYGEKILKETLDSLKNYINSN